MSNIEAGGSAFPTGTYEYGGAGNVLPYQDDGMTLRDYFASKALANSYANSGTAHDAARWAYEIADAMLKARGV